MPQNQPSEQVNGSIHHLRYALSLADNALILGHRLSEWCGHGPILEQDIALANTSLDHLGAARSLYQHAAQLFLALPKEDQTSVFTSPALEQRLVAIALHAESTPPPGHAVIPGHREALQPTTAPTIDEDALAYLRDGWDFRNLLLTELPNRDWAYTIVRSFLYDCFHYYQQEALRNSTDTALAAVAEKSVKEAAYHLRWSSEWLIRLGDGTEESHARAQQALDEYWPYSGEMLLPSAYETAMQQAGIAPDLSAIKKAWDARVASVLAEATLSQPPPAWMQQGGKEGRHTEHLGYALAELQFMQRAYPGMEW